MKDRLMDYKIPWKIVKKSNTTSEKKNPFWPPKIDFFMFVLLNEHVFHELIRLFFLNQTSICFSLKENKSHFSMESKSDFGCRKIVSIIEVVSMKNKKQKQEVDSNTFKMHVLTWNETRKKKHKVRNACQTKSEEIIGILWRIAKMFRLYETSYH